MVIGQSTSIHSSSNSIKVTVTKMNYVVQHSKVWRHKVVILISISNYTIITKNIHLRLITNQDKDLSTTIGWTKMHS